MTMSLVQETGTPAQAFEVARRRDTSSSSRTRRRVRSDVLMLWAHRILWPVAAYLSGQVAYWVWFTSHSLGWAAAISTTAFLIVAVLATVCTVDSWSRREL